MRILGIDHGDQHIGIAISDPLGFTAQPVTVLQKRANLQEDMLALKAVMDTYEQKVTEIVIGLPKTLAGKVGFQALKVIEYVGALKTSFPEIKVTTWDERFTSAAAEKNLISMGMGRKDRKKVIDKSAATYILQSYLDRKGYEKI